MKETINTAILELHHSAPDHTREDITHALELVKGTKARYHIGYELAEISWGLAAARKESELQELKFKLIVLLDQFKCVMRGIEYLM